MIPLSRREFIWKGSMFGTLGFGQLSFTERGFAAQLNIDDEVNRISRALMPRARRGGADHSAEEQTVERLKNVRLKRGGLNLQEREELYEATRSLPQIALEINFAFDSATLLPDAIPLLDALGQVLSQRNLQDNNIVVSGTPTTRAPQNIIRSFPSGVQTQWSTTSLPNSRLTGPSWQRSGMVLTN